MRNAERIAVRLRLIYPPEVRKLRQRELWLREWRRAKLCYLASAKGIRLKDPDDVEIVSGTEVRLNIWGEPVGKLPKEIS